LVVGCLVATVLLLPVAGAGAAPAPGCYPPPCGTAVDSPAAVDNQATLVGLPAAGPEGRSPAPFVAAGLFMVAACLTTICVKRRMALVAAAAAVAAPAPTPAVRRQLERSLR